MVHRVLSPVLVGRHAELSSLEESLLAASRGDGRLVLLAGEAGMGKTRLASELVAMARKLGFAVLAGGCSEAELDLPYLPFVQSLGNWLAGQEVATIAAAVGPAAGELGQLFPQLSGQPAGLAGSGDPGQAKLRLFEAIVSLLAVPARERGLLLVVEDIHWADTSSRELLEHVARRAAALRMLVLATYRSDELDRRHPLTSALQTWRRSGLAETVTVGALPPDGVARMIQAIFDSDETTPEFRDLMFERTEGNPFVLEEMLKDAIDRGDIYRTPEGWERKPIHELRIPDSVRHSILYRVERLEPAHVAILQAAAVLGRSFGYATLLAVTEAEGVAVQGALDSAVAQQLIEEDPEPGGPAAYRWRHALTQEAIASDIVLPRRQELHSRAADVLASDPAARSVHVALHLLEAGRFVEAVPAGIRAAAEAERAVAFKEAAHLYERVLPHVGDPLERARLACAIGRDLWLNAEAGPAEQWLARGVRGLEEQGQALEAARSRLVLGRTRWERGLPDLALRDFEAARTELEAAGPSADLALAYMRIAGLHSFALEEEEATEAARRAVEIATAAGADFERVWSEGFLALGLFGTGHVEEALALMARAQAEATEKGYVYVAQNLLYNEVWDRVHSMLGDLEDRLARFTLLPQVQAVVASFQGARA